MGALVGLEVLEKMNHAGESLIGFGVGIVQTMGRGFDALLHKGAEFEQMSLRIQSTGKTGAEARGLMQEALNITKQLPIAESDAVRIMTTLATAHVDALKPIGETYDQLAAKGKVMKDLPEIMGTERMKKEGPKVISVVGDMLAALGHLGSGYQGMAIHELMLFIETGAARSQNTFQAWQHEFRELGHKAKTAEDRIKGMTEILSKKGALGMSQAAMNTMGGIMSNFKSMMDTISVAVMEPTKPGGVMDKFNKGLAGLVRHHQDVLR
jgi:hypothetical protein